MARAALAQGNTARAGVGVAGRKPNRLRGLSVEGEVPQPDHRGEKPKQTRSDRSHPAMSGPGGTIPEWEKGITTPNRPLPRSSLAAPIKPNRELTLTTNGKSSACFQRTRRSPSVLQTV